MRLIAWVLVAAGLVAALPSVARPAAVRSGLRAGLNAATMTWDGDRKPEDVEGRQGLAGGIWVRVGLSPFLSLQAEVLYSQKGATLYGVPVRSFLGEPDPADFRFDLDYLELPLLARLGLPVGGAGSVYLVVGPSFAYKLRARSRIDYHDDDKPDREYEQKRLKNNDLGFGLGLGAEVGRFYLEGRWTRSLDHIFKYSTDPSWPGQQPADLRNSVLTVALGFGL